MNLSDNDFYAALIHELKNELALLTLAIEAIPRQSAESEAAVDAARLLCQRVSDRLKQALLVYKSAIQPLHPVIDAWPPAETVAALGERAAALTHGRLAVETELAPDLPDLWFYDRELVEMALINAVHNALAHARSRIVIRAGMADGCLAFVVQDDSAGYPDRVLNGHVIDKPTGTGLGLRFARLIAQSHENGDRRGAVRLANDGGAVFSLVLP